MTTANITPFILTSISGLRLSASERDLIQHPAIAGLIFFQANYHSKQQLVDLIHEIRSIRPGPFLLAVDQEGGRVQRFQSGFTTLPSLGSIGRLYDQSPSLAKTMTKAHATVMSIELLQLGIDFSFAPVLDLNRPSSRVIADRAFHADAQVVAELGEIYIHTLKQQGMIAVAKHFPGHGSIDADSHCELPRDDRAWSEIALHDLLPFNVAIKAGVDALMPAHVIYSQFDQLPAGFSASCLQQLLRQDLQFNGVIISDDLAMAGAGVVGDPVARANAALQAGCDFIILCHNAEAVAAICHTVTSPTTWHNQMDKLTRMQVNSSLKHVAQAKRLADAKHVLAQCSTSNG